MKKLCHMNGLVLETHQHLADQQLMDILQLTSLERTQQPLGSHMREVTRKKRNITRYFSSNFEAINV